jgi:hypothetical protein
MIMMVSFSKTVRLSNSVVNIVLFPLEWCRNSLNMCVLRVCFRLGIMLQSYIAACLSVPRLSRLGTWPWHLSNHAVPILLERNSVCKLLVWWRVGSAHVC